jgi:hypothetical protein
MKRSQVSAALLLALVGEVAYGQVHQIQGGNVLDANPQMGSAGFNRPGQVPPSGMSNRIVTGNVTGGASFRGFSPVRDSNALFIGSNAQAQTFQADPLSNFRRDSFSLSSVQQGYVPNAGFQPYYSRQTTVVSSGAIASGLNQPGSSQPLSSYRPPTIDLRVQPPNPLAGAGPSSGGGLSVPIQIARVDTGQTSVGAVNQQLLKSALFGTVWTIPANQLAQQTQQGAALAVTPGTALDTRVNKLEPLDMRMGEQNAAAQQARRSEANGTIPGAPNPADRRGQGQLSTAQMEARAQDQPLPFTGGQTGMGTQASGRPGDIFAQMRLASGQLLQSVAADSRENAQLRQPILPSTITPPRRGKAEAAGAGGTLEERMALAEGVAGEPLNSFVGTENTVLNKYLADAEALLKAGQYYKASAVYDLARTIDSRNPLPLLGKSMALLAAGDYMSSSSNLFQAIRLFESLADFRVNLRAMIPDINVLDRRRADLESQLATQENFQLRFLLGYAEYSSGMESLGLTNMRKAADEAPPEVPYLRRFVEGVQRHTTTQPAR